MSDLCMMIFLLKIVFDLERIGDNVLSIVNIWLCIKIIDDYVLICLKIMGKLVMLMLKDLD